MAVVRIKWIKHYRAWSIPGTWWVLNNCQLLLYNHPHLPPPPPSLGTILLCSCAFIIFTCSGKLLQGWFLIFFQYSYWDETDTVSFTINTVNWQLLYADTSSIVKCMKSHAISSLEESKRISFFFLAGELDLSLKRQFLSYQNHSMVPINSAGSFANNLKKIIP